MNNEEQQLIRTWIVGGGITNEKRPNAKRLNYQLDVGVLKLGWKARETKGHQIAEVPISKAPMFCLGQVIAAVS